MDIPAEWDYCKDSTYYKILHRFGLEFVMMWNNGEYHKSTKTVKELQPGKPPKPKVKMKPRKLVKEEAKKSKILRAITEKGARTKQQLQIDTNMNKSSLRYAIKDLRFEGKIERKDDLYSIPMQLSIFKGLTL